MRNLVYIVKSKNGEILATTQDEHYAAELSNYFLDRYEGVCVESSELTRFGDFYGDGGWHAFQVWLDCNGDLVRVKKVDGTESLFSPVHNGTRTEDQCAFGHIREMKHGGRQYFEIEETYKWNPTEYETKLQGCDFSALVFIREEHDVTGVDPFTERYPDFAEDRAKEARLSVMENMFGIAIEE